MKKRIKYNYSVLLGMLVGVAVASCSDTRDNPTATADSCEMELRLVADPATRSVATDEAAIRTVDVLVFNGKNVNYDDASFAYRRTAWSTDGGSTYRVVLLKADTVDVYFAINAGSTVAAAAPAQGDKWSAVREKLQLTHPEAVAGGLSTQGIPMWGQRLGVHVEAAATYGNLGIITLLRAMSSAEVVMKDRNFSLAAGYIAYGADRGYLPYDVAKLDAAYNVIAPFVPSTMSPTIGNDGSWKYTVQAGDTAIVGAFYLLENGDAVNNTKVILEGRWGGTTKPAGVNTFYPLAFHDPTNGLLKKNVTRNTKFIINITKVNADGYDDFDDAKDGEEVNMEYNIIQWDINAPAEAFIDGPNSLYIDPRRKDVKIGRAVGDDAELRFVTDFDQTKILMKLSATDVGENTLLDTQARFRLERLVRHDAAGNPYDCFVITAKQAYDAAATDNPATFIVDVDGRLRFTITVTQIDGGNGDWDAGYSVDGDAY